MGQTEDILNKAYEEMKKNNINKCVIASTTGETAKKAYELMNGKEIVVVRKHYGAGEKNVQEMLEENEIYLKQKNVNMVTATHVFGGIGRAVRKKYETWQVDEIIANTLRIMGNGVKVAIEISMMATDAGYINSGEKIIAIGGNKKGASNAVILDATNTNDFFDMKVHKII